MALDPRNPYLTDGFKVGMVNVQSPYKIPADALAAATNVDINDEGYIQRRQGYVQIRAGVAHSLYSQGATALYGEGSTIRQLNSDETTTEIVTGLSGADIAFETVNRDVYWANGTQSGKIVSGVNQAWGIPAGPIPAVAYSAVGVLPAAKYQVALTYMLADGEEGGSYQSSQITLAAAGGISVALPLVVPSGVTHYNIYCTMPNGEIEYLVGTASAAAGAYAITTLATASRTLETQGMDAFPPCTELQYFKGRMYGAYGRQLVFSPPMRYRLHRYSRDFFMLPSPVRMIAATNTGLYVSDETATYWLDGTDPEQMTLVDLFPYPAIARTKVYDPASGDPMWFSERGWIKGSDGGKADPVMEKRVLPGVVSPTGAGLFREYNGIRQVVAIVDETAAHTLSVRSQT